MSDIQFPATLIRTVDNGAGIHSYWQNSHEVEVADQATLNALLEKGEEGVPYRWHEPSGCWYVTGGGDRPWGYTLKLVAPRPCRYCKGDETAYACECV